MEPNLLISRSLFFTRSVISSMAPASLNCITWSKERTLTKSASLPADSMTFSLSSYVSFGMLITSTLTLSWLLL